MKNRSLSISLLLVFCIFIPLIIGFIGSFFTMTSVTGWYLTLNKPWFTPPGWVFGPAWTILYILMGVAWWFVLRNGIDSPSVKTATMWFLVQLVVNLLWSLIFFGMQSLLGGVIVILILILLIGITMLSFSKVSRESVILLIPYLCWTLFATILTISVYLLNSTM